MIFGLKEIREARELATSDARGQHSVFGAQIRRALSRALDALEEAHENLAEAREMRGQPFVEYSLEHAALIARAEKAERERDEARESLQRLSQVKFHTEHEYAKVFSRAEAAEARVMELRQENERLRDKLLSPEHPALQLVMSEGDQLRADLLRERERVKELERYLYNILEELPNVPPETIASARAALSHHKTYGEVAQIPSEGPGRGAGAEEREQPVVNRTDAGVAPGTRLPSNHKEPKP